LGIPGQELGDRRPLAPALAFQEFLSQRFDRDGG
jgi:hypothetical protein